MKIKQFFKRWKEGIEGITKKQQIKMQVQSMYIMLLGISLGIMISMINLKDLYWLLIILIGGYFNATIGILSLMQQYRMIKKIENLTFESEIKPIGVKNV